MSRREPTIHPFSDGGFICVVTDDIREAQGFLVEHVLEDEFGSSPTYDERLEAEEIAYGYPAEVQFGKMAPVDRYLREAEGWSWQWIQDFRATERPKGHSVAVVFVR